MTTFAELIEQLKLLPPERQEDAKRILEVIASAGAASYRLSPQERTLINEGLGSRTVSATELREFRDRDPERDAEAA